MRHFGPLKARKDFTAFNKIPQIKPRHRYVIKSLEHNLCSLKITGAINSYNALTNFRRNPPFSSEQIHFGRNPETIGDLMCDIGSIHFVRWLKQVINVRHQDGKLFIALCQAVYVAGRISFLSLILNHHNNIEPLSQNLFKFAAVLISNLNI